MEKTALRKQSSVLVPELFNSYKTYIVAAVLVWVVALFLG